MIRSLLLLLVAAVSLPACARVEGSFQRTFQVTGPVDLDAATRSGNVVVHTGGAGTVVINAKIHTDNSWFSGSDLQGRVREIEQNPPVSQSGNAIRIENLPRAEHISIDYDITVPPETTARVHTGSGDVSVSGVRGAVLAKTGSGNVSLADLASEANVDTGSGDVSLRSLGANCTVRTGSGNIVAEGVSNAFRAETGSGDVRFRQSSAGDVTVRTGSGNISVDNVNGAVSASAGSGDISVNGTQKGVWRFNTGSGNVRVHLPGDAAFDVDAHTTSGTISSQHPVSTVVQGNLDKTNRQTLNGKVRGGGALLSVRTGSGDIRIE